MQEMLEQAVKKLDKLQERNQPLCLNRPEIRILVSKMLRSFVLSTVHMASYTKI